MNGFLLGVFSVNRVIFLIECFFLKKGVSMVPGIVYLQYKEALFSLLHNYYFTNTKMSL